MRPLRRALLPLLAALLAVLAPAPAAAATETGVDVSRYQHPDGGPVDWTRVAGAGADFAFVKATEGTSVSNAWFAADWRGARAAGLHVGAYHYARPSTASGSAAAQARRFAAAIGDQTRPGTLPPVLDLESSGGLSRSQLTAWTRSFLTTLEDLTGRRPIVYTYPSFWKDAMGSTTAFAGYPLWIAHYSAVARPLHPGWSSWTFWQHSQTARISGISGAVDMNRFAGTAQDLARLALAAPPAASQSDPVGVAPGSAPAAAVPAGVEPDTAPGRWTPLPAARLVDTRTGVGAAPGRVTRPLTLTLPASVPADAAGVVLNVSAVEPLGPGYLRVAAAGRAAGTTALNHAAGRSTTGLVVTRADAQRRVTLDVRGGAPHLVVDLVGAYDTATGSGGHWQPTAPTRVADSRAGVGAPRGAVQGAVTLSLPVPAGSRGAVLSVSAVQASRDAYVRVAAAGSPDATTAVNVAAGDSTTGLVLAPTDATGAVTLTVHGGPAHLVVDLVGHYTGTGGSGSSWVGTSARRLADTRAGGGGRSLTVTLPREVPAGAAAAVLNVSTVVPGADGYLRVAPTGEQATTTALTYVRGRSQTGLVVVRPSGRGQVTVSLHGGAADVVVDLVGYQTASGNA